MRKFAYGSHVVLEARSMRGFDALPAVLTDLAERWNIEGTRSSSAGACPSSSAAERQTVARPC